MRIEELEKKIYVCLDELAHDDGFNASGKSEVFGCIFGRDSFITILKLLRTLKVRPDGKLLSTCKKSLLKHIELQGKNLNIESGEQLGKFIHEYRVDKYERLTARRKPWYVYPDKILRNYDSIDATPLGLIAIYRYWELTNDGHFLLTVLPSVEKGLNWIMSYGDMDKDYLLEYSLPAERLHGGLAVQSWADSIPSLADTAGKLPDYPIAPVEVQGIAWLALRLWSNYFSGAYKETQNIRFSKKLRLFADKMKKRFNRMFLMSTSEGLFLAQALDGHKRQVRTVTSHPLICLWSAIEENDHYESIIDEVYINSIVHRAFETDLFVPGAGMRTMSTKSSTFDPTEASYHNGSFWPMLNGLIIEGLHNFDYFTEAAKLSNASLSALQYFGLPIELYIQNEGKFSIYRNPLSGQQSCLNQAWSAASAYDLLLSVIK